MIVKKYNANINVNAPINYFENWYADVWRSRVARSTCEPGILESLLTEEMSKYGGNLNKVMHKVERVHKVGHDYQLNDKYEVSFHDDAEYTLFVLKWS